MFVFPSQLAQPVDSVDYYGREILWLDYNLGISHFLRFLTIDDVCQAIHKLGDVSANSVVRFAEASLRSVNGMQGQYGMPTWPSRL